jgi:uncharacterized protein (TIGR02145 family)
MEKAFLLVAFSVFCIHLKAQPYSLSFSGTGLSTVKVQNLTTGIIVDVPAGDMLYLSPVTGMSDNNLQTKGLKVYPNPMTERSILEILPPVAGDAIISVCDITGKVLILYKEYLENCVQVFSLSGIKNGLYLINVRGIGYQFSEKLLSDGKSDGKAGMSKLSNNIQPISENKSIKDFKGTGSAVNMAYNSGERLKFTAVSGNNSTIRTFIPTADETITFNFYTCTDRNNNNYSVVQIDTLIWMAENLKTTVFSDSTSIPYMIHPPVQDSPDRCWYNNSISYKNYGALYNWFAVNTGKLCPAGWHVPGDEEWTTLINFLGGETIAGGLLKETGTSHWKNPNTAATDESGFAALPAGYRDYFGDFWMNGSQGSWWSSTVSSAAFSAWDRRLNYNTGNVTRGQSWKSSGYSVRCVKDK